MRAIGSFSKATWLALHPNSCGVTQLIYEIWNLVLLHLSSDMRDL